MAATETVARLKAKPYPSDFIPIHPTKEEPNRRLPRVAIDCIALPRYFSGAAYYMYYLTTYLLSAPRSFHLSVICKPHHISLFDKHLKSGDSIIPVTIRNRLEQLRYYEYDLRKLLIQKNVQVFHATHYLCPPSDSLYKIVNTIHDMGFVLHPEYYPMVKRVYFALRMRRFLQRSARLITVSENTARDLASKYPDQNEKIRPVYPGTDHLNAIPAATHSLLPQKYMLAVNSIEKRKHIPFIIDVFERLKSKSYLPHKLIIVGPKANGYGALLKQIEQSPNRRDITLKSNLSLQDMKHLYSNADCFLNASDYEGFGFTPFEAVAMGCPAFLYQNGVIEEVFGNHPYIFKSLDATEWSRFIAEEMQSGYRHQISTETITTLNWENTARRVSKMYMELANEREPKRA